MKKMDLENIDQMLKDQIGRKPKANNEMDPKASYYNKKLYEMKSFKTGVISNNKPVNILYEKQFYGRVDLQHIPVIVDSATLKSRIIADGSEVKFLNFVHDAQTAFFSYWEFLKKIKKVTKSSAFYDISIKSSYIDPGTLYFKYMNSMFDDFKNYLKVKKVIIKKFDNFIDQFLDFVDIATPANPILFSTFVGSRMAEPLISGICFDVNRLDLTEDSLKYSLFTEDPNYALFKKTATKFGFFVDKHIPWRLWADIDSPAMKPYMDVYNLSQDNIYEKNYVQANGYDLELLRFYLIQFYNTYITNNQEINEPEFKICSKTGNMIVNMKTYKLDFIKFEQVKTSLEFDRLILRLYAFIKVRENNYSWNKAKFENVVLTFIQIKEGLDTKAAIRYIEPLVRVPAAADFKQRNFTFR